MKRYRVTYVTTKFEIYEVTAPNKEMAEDNFMEGTLVQTGDEDGNIQSIKEIKS